MEESIRKENEISLLDIVRLLLSKIKILILVVLVGAILGGAFAVWRTINVDYYGTRVEFFINPESEKEEDSSSANSQYAVYGSYSVIVMDAITKLLASESFSEKLILGDNTLPDINKYPDLNKTEYAEAEAEILKAEAAWAKVETLKKEEKEYKEELELAEEIQKNTDKEVEEVLEEWRTTDRYKTDISRYSSSVSYSYLNTSEDIDNVNNLAKSFIYVEISVLNDKEFAQEVLDKVKKYVPAYVEANMIKPVGYTGTSCTRINRIDDIYLTNPNYTRNQAIKYAFLAAAIAGILAAVIVIIIDRSDKRLRDHEAIVRNFNVPVLGLIPTINEMQMYNAEKQQDAGARK